MAPTLETCHNWTDRLLRLFRAKDAAVAVAVAVAAPKPKPKTLRAVQHTELTVLVAENKQLGWVSDEAQPGHWSDFLKWYHGRPQSTCYVMEHSQGHTMVRREDIISYDIRNWQSFTEVR